MKNEVARLVSSFNLLFIKFSMFFFVERYILLEKKKLLSLWVFYNCLKVLNEKFWILINCRK